MASCDFHTLSEQVKLPLKVGLKVPQSIFQALKENCKEKVNYENSE